MTGSFRLPRADGEAASTDAREAMARVIAASRAEPGCLAYDYAEDVLEPGLFRVCEAWTDREALAAHFRQPHMARWREEREAMGLTERRITAHEVTRSEPL